MRNALSRRYRTRSVPKRPAVAGNNSPNGFANRIARRASLSPHSTTRAAKPATVRMPHYERGQFIGCAAKDGGGEFRLFGIERV